MDERGGQGEELQPGGPEEKLNSQSHHALAATDPHPSTHTQLMLTVTLSFFGLLSLPVYLTP